MDKVLPVIEMPKPPPTAEVAPIPTEDSSGVESDKELIKELLEDNIQENVYSDIIEVDERERVSVNTPVKIPCLKNKKTI